MYTPLKSAPAALLILAANFTPAALAASDAMQPNPTEANTTPTYSFTQSPWQGAGTISFYEKKNQYHDERRLKFNAATNTAWHSAAPQTLSFSFKGIDERKNGTKKQEWYMGAEHQHFFKPEYSLNSGLGFEHKPANDIDGNVILNLALGYAPDNTNTAYTLGAQYESHYNQIYATAKIAINKNIGETLISIASSLKTPLEKTNESETETKIKGEVRIPLGNSPFYTAFQLSKKDGPFKETITSIKIGIDDMCWKNCPTPNKKQESAPSKTPRPIVEGPTRHASL